MEGYLVGAYEGNEYRVYLSDDKLTVSFKEPETGSQKFTVVKLVDGTVKIKLSDESRHIMDPGIENKALFVLGGDNEAYFKLTEDSNSPGWYRVREEHSDYYWKINGNEFIYADSSSDDATLFTLRSS